MHEQERERLIELIKDVECHPEKTCPNLYNNDNCPDCEYDEGDVCNCFARKADYLLANGVIVLPCKVGDTVYIIERDVDGFADTISGYVFLAQTDNVVIVSCFINDYDVKGIISHHIIETAEDYGTDLAVFPREDMFLAKEEAEAALKEEKNK